MTRSISCELFCYCDLELDHITFISELDLVIVVTYLHAKNEVNRSNGSKVRLLFGQTHRQCIKLELFHYCDLELDPMTFISERDLDIVVTYLNDKNEVNRSNGSKVIIRTDTDRQTRVKSLPSCFCMQ